MAGQGCDNDRAGAHAGGGATNQNVQDEIDRERNGPIDMEVGMGPSSGTGTPTQGNNVGPDDYVDDVGDVTTRSSTMRTTEAVMGSGNVETVQDFEDEL